MVDQTYTTDDHTFRESDEYARGKYVMTLRWLGPGRGRTLLNIGCGNGLFTEMAIAAGFDVEACEPDPVAHAAAAAATPGVSVHLGGLFDVTWDRPTADVVVMHDVLEHIEDEPGAIDRVVSLLDDRGRAIISVPALQPLYGLHDELLGHYRRYSKHTLRDAVSRRMSIERLRYFGFSFLPVTLWYSRIRRQPYPTATATGPNMIGRAFSLACRVEERIPTPIGTSLVCEAVRPSATS
jgi:2-polyprenyl-3-methyl-5-hydroxy-6-metoxy-1,4-benzoquinol methylase